MKKKNKYKIGFWIIAALSVILAMVVVAVLAAYVTKSSSGISISYKADANVDAKITVEYKKATAELEEAIPFTMVKSTTGENCIEFDTGDQQTSVTKEFETITQDIREDEFVLIHYNVKNRSTVNSLTMKMELVNRDVENMNVKYCLTNSANAEDWLNSLDAIIDSQETIAQNAQLEFYVKIAVNIPTQEANFVGTFNFELDAVEITE